MKTETFTKNFEHIIGAPNGITHLRRLILGLAVRGKLANQNQKDGSAEAILETISAEKQRRISAKQFNVSEIESPALLASQMPLPAGWIACQIADICELKTGATPSRHVHKYFGGDIKWLVSGDIHKQDIYDCDGRITQEGMENSNCKILPAGSVLMALNGQGKTRATVAILRTEAACNQSLVAMIPILPAVMPEYIFWYLRGKYKDIRDITGQNQRRGLNMKLIGSLAIELPPYAEQKRIVAEVSKLMALCDDLDDKIARAQVSADTLAASFVHHLCNMSEETAKGRKGED